MTSRAADSPPLHSTIAVVGVGLIGGSLAAAVRRRGLAERVIGVGRSALRLEQARVAGLIDESVTDLAMAVSEAELVVFCTPVERIADGVREAARTARPGCLLTDAGSIKASICRELTDLSREDVQFIGSHPIAGSEKNGFEYADADLFDGRVCVITPPEDAQADHVSRLRRFWSALGMTVVEMSPGAHDEALAETSHLPHVVAAALAGTLVEKNRLLTATGFRDTTRIAAGDPDLWTGILLGNREYVLESLSRFRTQFDALISAIEQYDADKLRSHLQQSKSVRDSLTDQQSPSVPTDH